MAPSSKKNEPYLPKQIRDELRMTAAMRCYSVLREGDGKKLSELYSSMFDLYHGNESSGRTVLALTLPNFTPNGRDSQLFFSEIFKILLSKSRTYFEILLSNFM